MSDPDPLDRKTRQALWLLVAAGVVVVIFFSIVTIVRLPRRLADSFGKREEKTVTAGEIVTQVRALNRLETVSVEVMNVSTTTQSYGMVPRALAGDELTFLAVGQVIAGLDLSRMTDRDVRIDGKRIIVYVPPAEILVTRIDNHKSHVLSRDSGMLRKGDVDLESRVRERAEGAIRSKAIREGILPLAQKNGAERVAELLHRAGYDSVEVTVKPMPAKPLETLQR